MSAHVVRQILFTTPEVVLRETSVVDQDVAPLDLDAIGYVVWLDLVERTDSVRDVYDHTFSHEALERYRRHIGAARREVKRSVDMRTDVQRGLDPLRYDA